MKDSDPFVTERGKRWNELTKEEHAARTERLAREKLVEEKGLRLGDYARQYFFSQKDAVLLCYKSAEYSKGFVELFFSYGDSDHEINMVNDACFKKVFGQESKTKMLISHYGDCYDDSTGILLTFRVTLPYEAFEKIDV